LIPVRPPSRNDEDGRKEGKGTYWLSRGVLSWYFVMPKFDESPICPSPSWPKEGRKRRKKTKEGK
jgi:hypothetical protein